MSLFGVLNVGATGMRTHQFGVSNAGQNATNAATEGYSRRRVTIQPLPHETVGGARAVGSRRVMDQLVEKRLLGARSQSSYEGARMEIGQTVDELFADVQGGIGARMDAFQQALADFANYPDDTATRTVVLQSAEDLARSFGFTADVLEATRADANARIEDGVEQVNAMLGEIATLGIQISRHENPLGQEASDLRDRRDQLVREVSDLVPTKAIEQDDGSVSLLLGGSLAMVSPDGAVTELQTTTDPTSGNVSVARMSAGVLEDVSGLLTAGKIGGAIETRDNLVADTATRLDQLAFDTAAAYNAVHQVGVGLDGATGRNLFEPTVSVSGAARAFSVSTDVSGAPDRLAAAQDAAALPGDDRGALALVAVADGLVANGGTETLGTSFGNMLGAVGTEVRSINSAADHSATVAEQVEAVRQGVSGVSTDEEMISLSKFQRAYEASIQVVRTADQLLAELISLTR